MTRAEQVRPLSVREVRMVERFRALSDRQKVNLLKLLEVISGVRKPVEAPQQERPQ